MSNIAIKFENISKQYRLGTVGTGTLSHDLNRWWHTIRGKEDPYLTVGQTNDRAAKATSDYVWALKDISFDIEQGDVVGIIGKNGAGKSTLLKLLSRVTSPTTGMIKAKGRIASLLEVGTGFHPELTGRENIYMNGAIMGMTKAEITRKLDEIVDFAGVEMYIDTPTKRYSSGMTVRLGFAIAAHLEPEILVVDEVLAVGDAEFQKKAIGKMQDVSHGEGRTVLFVSHNMASVKSLCNTGVILKDGTVHASGDINSIVSEYLQMNQGSFNPDMKLADRKDREGNQNAFFSDIIMSSNGFVNTFIPTGVPIKFTIEIESKEEISHAQLFLSIYNMEGIQMIHSNTNIASTESITLKKGLNKLICNFDSIPLQVGNYYINLAMDDQFGNRLDRVEKALIINIEENNIYKTSKIPHRHQGMLLIPSSWES